MNQENKKLVIFDFDGVLVNTIDFSFAIHKLKNNKLTWQKFKDYSNGNFNDGIGEAIAQGEHIPADNWADDYAKNIKDLTISDVLIETIKKLSSEYILTIVSSSSTYLINNFLEKEKIRENFSDVLGNDVDRSKVIKIKSLLKKYNIHPSDTVLITDSLGDILEGNECKINSIGVTWGIHDFENLSKGYPISIVDDPRYLLSFINDVLK